MVYIGMKPAESALEELQRELDIAYQKRKQEQARQRFKLDRAVGNTHLIKTLSLSREICPWRKLRL